MKNQIILRTTSPENVIFALNLVTTDIKDSELLKLRLLDRYWGPKRGSRFNKEIYGSNL